MDRLVYKMNLSLNIKEGARLSFLYFYTLFYSKNKNKEEYK
jgi:hypothetical protein